MTGTYTLPDKLREYAERAVNLDELRPLMLRAAKEIDLLRAALAEIERNYANQDMSHLDFRVGAGQAAWNALRPEVTNGI